MTKLREGETYSTEGPECPACGFTCTPDDSIYYDERNYTKEECQECGQKFSVEVHHSTAWNCEIITGGDNITETETK